MKDHSMTADRFDIIDPAETRALTERWDRIQTQFVDDPRGSVADADDLVSETIDKIVRHFEYQREELERQWKEGQEVSTEDLRRTLQTYRSFFSSLLPADID